MSDPDGWKRRQGNLNKLYIFMHVSFYEPFIEIYRDIAHSYHLSKCASRILNCSSLAGVISYNRHIRYTEMGQQYCTFCKAHIKTRAVKITVLTRDDQFVELMQFFFLRMRRMTRPVYPIIHPTLSTHPHSNMMADCDPNEVEESVELVGPLD